MSCLVGPRAVIRDVLLNFDSENVYCTRAQNSNLNYINWLDAYDNAALPSGWLFNGGATKNEITIASNPWGHDDVIINSLPNVDSASDGGYESNIFNIDNSKLYRFCCWIKRANTTSADGNTYLGFRAFDSTSTTQNVINKNTGATSTNPYWYDLDIWNKSWFELDTWFLFVGHVWPVGTTADNTQHPNSGIWKANGTKVANITRDWIWGSTCTRARNRAYLFFETSSTANQQFYQPITEEVSQVDRIYGTELRFNDLISNGGNKWYDRSGNGYHAFRAGDTINYDPTEKAFIFSANTDPVNAAGQEQGIYITGLNYTTGSADAISALTVDSWIKCFSTNLPTYGDSIILSYDRSSVFRWSISNTNGGVPYFSFASANTPGGTENIFDVYALNANTDLRDDQWHYIAATFDTENIIFYIDGQQVDSYSDTYGLISNQADTETTTYGVIGTGSELRTEGDVSTMTPSTPFYGYIRKITVYNTVLSASEILQNYNALKNRFT
jgi:hypothetical protein